MAKYYVSYMATAGERFAGTNFFIKEIKEPITSEVIDDLRSYIGELSKAKILITILGITKIEE